MMDLIMMSFKMHFLTVNYIYSGLYSNAFLEPDVNLMQLLPEYLLSRMMLLKLQHFSGELYVACQLIECM